MNNNSKYSIDGSAVTEKEFLKKKMHQLNIAGIDHVIEPFLIEINRQHGCIEYKNDAGISSVVVHNVTQELNNRIQNEIEQNRFYY